MVGQVEKVEAAGREEGEGAYETLDALGPVRLFQHRSGYRFTIDARLLADFASDGRDDRGLDVVDLGTGCGVVALTLKSRQPSWRVTGLELQPGLHELALRNAGLNGLDVRMLAGDLRGPPAELGRGYDLVVSNPPYFEAQAGLLSPTGERALARHDATCSASDLGQAAKRLLKSSGSLCVVYPSARLAGLLSALQVAGLAPTRMRFVHSSVTSAAGVVLVESRPHARRPLFVEPPLLVRG
jgi:tRNA1Val (adenine37-N6)-methyltransferase